jgi:hypothetical protein
MAPCPRIHYLNKAAASNPLQYLTAAEAKEIKVFIFGLQRAPMIGLRSNPPAPPDEFSSKGQFPTASACIKAIHSNDAWEITDNHGPEPLFNLFVFLRPSVYI